MMSIDSFAAAALVFAGRNTATTPKRSRIRSPLRRVNLALPAPLTARLHEAMALTTASSLTDALKAAIKLYVAAVFAAQRGEVLVFRSAGGTGADRQVDLDILV